MTHSAGTVPRRAARFDVSVGDSAWQRRTPSKPPGIRLAAAPRVRDRGRASDRGPARRSGGRRRSIAARSCGRPGLRWPPRATCGTIAARAYPVSSIISTMVEIGPCVVAASIAAAPSSANNPGGTPGQSHDQGKPSTPPSAAPTARDGVNRPPGAPLPRHMMVAAGRRSRSATSSSGPMCPVNASSAMSRPLPSNCGSGIDAAPSTPSAATGAHTRRRPGRLVAIGPGHRPDIEHRDQTRDRPGQQRPRDAGERTVIRRDDVESARRAGTAQDTSVATSGGDHGGQHEAQREGAAQHLQREQRAAEGHAVGCRHACPGAAGDQQPAFLVGQADPVGHRVGDHRARLFGRTLAA